jgi:hypothetical protein
MLAQQGAGSRDRVVAEDGVAKGDQHATRQLRAPGRVVAQPLVLRRLVLVCRRNGTVRCWFAKQPLANSV